MWRMLSIIQQQKMIFFVMSDSCCRALFSCYLCMYKNSFHRFVYYCYCWILKRALSADISTIFLIFFNKLKEDGKKMLKFILIFKSNMSKMIKYEPLILTLSHGFTVIVIHFYVVNRYIYRSLFSWILFCVVPFFIKRWCFCVWSKWLFGQVMHFVFFEQ
jgi:hypothetical protein